MRNKLAKLRRKLITYTDVHTVYSCHRYVQICGIEAFRYSLHHNHAVGVMEWNDGSLYGRRKYVVVM